MPTLSEKYTAPFGPGGPSEADDQLAGKLIALALGKGAEYADLFFEYRAAGGFVFDEGILKSASRGVSMGLGVRAQKGDATGYAYTEESRRSTISCLSIERRVTPSLADVATISCSTSGSGFGAREPGS